MYVTMVIGELREGRRSLQSVADLPQGLAAYYERLLVGSGLTDQAAALTALLCALSLAVEPVDEQTLVRVVGRSMPGGPKLWEQVIRNALDRAHAFLASMPTPEGRPGFLLHHESLRQFLLEHAGVRLMREGAKAAWLQYCGEWKSSKAPYALRNHAHHLRDAGEYERLIELVRDTCFLRFQRDTLTHHPLAPITTLQLALDAAIDGSDTAAVAEFAMASAQRRLELRQVSPMQTLEQGGVQLALQLADSYPSAERIIWYCLLARALADGSDCGQAQTVWRQAESMMADAREKGDLPRYVEDCVGFLREGMPCSPTLSGADTSVLGALEQKGVSEYLASALRERELSDLLSAGDLAGAEHVASLMDDSRGQRGQALARIAVRRAGMAQPDAVPKSYDLSFEVAEGIGDGGSMCTALCIIAERQASRGDVQCAAARARSC